jgi:hypothetical protein
VSGSLSLSILKVKGLGKSKALEKAKIPAKKTLKPFVKVKIVSNNELGVEVTDS